MALSRDVKIEIEFDTDSLVMKINQQIKQRVDDHYRAILQAAFYAGWRHGWDECKGCFYADVDEMAPDFDEWIEGFIRSRTKE